MKYQRKTRFVESPFPLSVLCKRNTVQNMASSATARIDWTSLATKLKPETMASLNGFRRRHADLSKKLIELKESSVTVDLSGYQLKNTKVIAEATKALSAFKPATYDLKERLDFIQKQETKAVRMAHHLSSPTKSQIC